ncbi:MAG: elongation factor G, partial [Acidobacteria bacterium]|nr:elongation factor G [Acidobacteriota bacterium]
TGGSGQYAKVQGTIEPADDGEFHFVNKVVGGNIPSEYIGACEKGFASSVDEGQYIGAPVQGLQVTLVDGASHAVDSSDMAFQTAARAAFRATYHKAKPQILEPVMKVSVEGPGEFQGAIYRSLMLRRGNVLGSTEDAGFARVEAEVPLAAMFGYSTDLRSETQGKAEFTMEFAKYAPAPAEVTKELLEKYKGQVAEEED